MEEVITRLSEQLEGVIQKEVDIFMSTIFYRIIYDFHTKYKRRLSHDCDPLYDSSGNTYISFNDQYFSAADYETVGDFLEEYNGNTIASFISGCGLSHQTFGEYYQDELERHLRGIMSEFLRKIDDDDYEALSNEIYNSIPKGWSRSDVIRDIGCYFDEFEYSICQKAEEIINTIKQVSFLFWYKKLSKQVLCDIEQERAILRREKGELQLQIQKEKQKFKRLWSRLEKCHMLMYQKNLPKQVYIDGYREFCHFLKQNNVTDEEIMLILEYSPIQFSNKVIRLLENAR